MQELRHKIIGIFLPVSTEIVFLEYCYSVLVGCINGRLHLADIGLVWAFELE